ncbi:MAG: oligosaccharide flippase family protein [Planctomycetota bacterium]
MAEVVSSQPSSMHVRRAPRGRRLVHGVATLSAAQLIGHLCSFGRNVLLARLLGPVDFGIAAAFAAIVVGLEMISDLSMDKLVVQSPRGDDPSFLRVLHGLMLVRAVILSALLFVLGGVLAHALHAPEAINAFRALAIIPLVRGFLNIDVIRAHRQLRFAPSAFVDAVPQVVTLALTVPAVAFIGSFWAVFWLLLLRAALATGSSHLLATQRWRIGWNRGDTREAIRFGWPLLLNGMMMFAIIHADKLVVGSTCDLSTLASYAVAAMLASMPALLLARAVGSAYFPMLASCQHDAHRFRTRSRMILALYAALGVIAVAGLIVVGEPIVRLVFGNAYAPAIAIIPWFAAVHALRLYRAGITMIALARGDSTTSLLANLVRAPALLVQIPVAIMTGSPLAIIFVALIAEVPSIIVALHRIRTRHGVAMRDVAVPAILLMTACLALIIVSSGSTVTVLPWLRMTAALTLAATVLFAMLVTMPTSDRRTMQRTLIDSMLPEQSPC